MTESRIKLVIEVANGEVRDVYTTAPRVDVTVVHWDTQDCRPGLRNLHRIRLDKDRAANVLVYPLETAYPELLPGTDLHPVLEATGHAFDDEQNIIDW
ncbi:MAG: hypothetical protein R3C19_26820 [Planctomycetaceae bacterium]